MSNLSVLLAPFMKIFFSALLIESFDWQERLHVLIDKTVPFIHPWCHFNVSRNSYGQDSVTELVV